MLSPTMGKKLNTYTPDYVVFDLETTGTSCMKDAVVEISGVKVRAGRIVEEFSTLVNPECHISPWASEVNGIYDDMVKDSPVFRVALKDFLDFAGDDILVGHNIHSFDMKFMHRDAQKYWGLYLGNDTIDTLPMARAYLPELPHHRLVDLAAHYGISPEGAHRALNDCRMNQQVFEHLAQELKKGPAKGIKLCPKCGMVLKLRNGKFGEFWGCTGYPDCKFTRNV